MSAFNEDGDQEQTKCYLVTPSYKNSVYEDIMYTKYYGDTRVSLKVTKIWRYGEFEVDLTISESKEIIKLNEVNLNEYCTCAASTDNLVEYDAEVLNIDKYDKQLQKQINLDVFEDVDNEYPYDDSELVDEHGWEIDDTLYSIVGGVELDKEDKDDDEDDESEDDESEDDESEEEEDDEGDGARFGDIINNDEDEKVEEKEEEQILTGSAQQCKYVKTDLVYLCINMDCDQYPPDWDFKKDTEETYQGDPWLKCNQCDGYYNNDAGGDILYVQEEPNNQEAECDLCGKTKDIVQMKGTGQYLCGNACDESDEEEEEEEIEPTICTNDCACDKHPTSNVVKKDEHGNYNVIIVPVIESATCSDHTAFSEWFNSNIRRFEYIEAVGEDVEEVMRIWCEANNHEWRDDGVYNMNIHVPAHAPAAGSGVENDDESPDAFECDDCNVKGMNCFENLGMSKDEVTAYMDLGQPDRCEKCFDIWKNTDDAKEYLQTIDDDDASTVSLGGCDTDFMEDEGEWGLDETYYYIYSGCVLVPEGENIEDYAQGDGSYANKKEDPVSVFDLTDA